MESGVDNSERLTDNFYSRNQEIWRDATQHL